MQQFHYFGSLSNADQDYIPENNIQDSTQDMPVLEHNTYLTSVYLFLEVCDDSFSSKHITVGAMSQQWTATCSIKAYTHLSSYRDMYYLN